jgi:hypothetical protein
LHAGQADIADVLAAPAHEAVVLLAQEARADALLGHVVDAQPIKLSYL